MKQLIAAICIALAAAAMHPPALGQGTGASKGGAQRMQGGGINYAPKPGIYEVIAVDSYFRTGRIGAAGGRTADVFVDDDIIDISRLKRGARIQVDLLQQDEPTAKPRAASVWPVQ